MSKARGLSDTELMKKLVEEPEDKIKVERILPSKLLFALRMALESGLTCEEISSIIIISAGLRELKSVMGTKEVTKRSIVILEIIKEDIDRRKGQYPPVV